jgi:hypothetical protein
VISANIGSYPDRPACGKSEPHASPPVEIDPRSGLLADHVRQINVVFVAYIFHGLYAGPPKGWCSSSSRFWCRPTNGEVYISSAVRQV